MSIRDLFQKDAVGKGLIISFKDFPRLLLYGEDVRVEFDAGGVNVDFLKRALDGSISKDGEKMLRGISLLQRSSQEKYMRLLSNGLLTMDNVARALCRAAGSSKAAEA